MDYILGEGFGSTDLETVNMTRPYYKKWNVGVLVIDYIICSVDWGRSVILSRTAPIFWPITWLGFEVTCFRSFVQINVYPPLVVTSLRTQPFLIRNSQNTLPKFLTPEAFIHMKYRPCDSWSSGFDLGMETLFCEALEFCWDFWPSAAVLLISLKIFFLKVLSSWKFVVFLEDVYERREILALPVLSSFLVS